MSINSSASTPPRREYHPAETPRKSRNRYPAKAIEFHKNKLPFETHSSLDFLKQKNIEVQFYRSPSDTLHALVKQPTTKACGPACLMMLFLDHVMEAANPKDRFELAAKDEKTVIHSFRMQSGLTNARYLRDHAPLTMNVIVYGTEKALSVDENETFADVEQVVVQEGRDVIENLKKRLEKGSVIQAITHPEIEGHWIIVDESKNGNFYVRDPFSASAYKLSEKELEEMLLKEVKLEFALQMSPKK